MIELLKILGRLLTIAAAAGATVVFVDWCIGWKYE
jgi:hypothetical protein